MRQSGFSNLPKIKIIKKVSEVKLKLKRGKDTPGIHVRALRDYMKHFQHLYKSKEIPDLLERAQQKIKKITQNRTSFNTQDLWNLFGGQPPASDADQQYKNEFILNRTNALVLQAIYQKYEMQIVFGSPKIEDKLTIFTFIREFRSRLQNPLLCGKIECPRPKLPQKKN